jgi:hypothetical protein
MQLPEVQDMLRRLSAFQLGIFMPPRQDDATGESLRLPDDGPQRVRLQGQPPRQQPCN